MQRLGAAGAGAVVDDVVGVMSWESPGVPSPCMLRPPVALLPESEEPDAATPASGAEVEVVEVVPLAVAPASESELVVVEKAFVGETAVDVVVFVVVVESLLWRVVPLVVVPELALTESVVVVGA